MVKETFSRRSTTVIQLQSPWWAFIARQVFTLAAPGPRHSIGKHRTVPIPWHRLTFWSGVASFKILLSYFEKQLTFDPHVPLSQPPEDSPRPTRARQPPFSFLAFFGDFWGGADGAILIAWPGMAGKVHSVAPHNVPLGSQRKAESKTPGAWIIFSLFCLGNQYNININMAKDATPRNPTKRTLLGMDVAPNLIIQFFFALNAVPWLEFAEDWGV